MNAERQALIDSLAADPDNDGIRLAFADWLDEHDEPEEAAWQREIARERPGAIEWMTKFAKDCGETSINYSAEYGDYIDRVEAAEAAGETNPYLSVPRPEFQYEPITLGIVIGAGQTWLNTAHDQYGPEYFTQMGSETARDMMSSEDTRRAYWRNWSLITGTRVRFEDIPEEGRVFSCSC